MEHCFITVRSDSSRLPGKCLKPFGTYNTVIEHIIERVRYFGFKPIISTTLDNSDNIIENIAQKNSVLYYRGSTQNKLLRWVDTAKKLKIEYFHTVDADDPFFDGSQIKKSLKMLEIYDFVYPSKYSSSGLGSEGFSIKSDFLEKNILSSKDSTDTEMIYDHINLSNAKTHVLDDLEIWNDYKLEKPRLTLDYIEDYVSLNTISSILGNMVSSYELHKFFAQNPNWIDINKDCNLKWKINQNLKSKYRIHDI